MSNDEHDMWCHKARMVHTTQKRFIDGQMRTVDVYGCYRCGYAVKYNGRIIENTLDRDSDQ